MSKQSSDSKRPTHGIYQVHGEGDKARWTKIGAAWLHKDTKGANMQFDALPLTGRVVMRELTEQDATGQSDATGNGGQK